MSKAAPTYYLFHGVDDFSRKAEVRAMRARMGADSAAELNTSLIDGRDTTAGKVLAAAEAMPFLSDKRLVVVDGLLTWLGRKGAGKEARAELDLLVERLPMLPDWARVVFSEPARLPDSHPVIKLMQADSHGFRKEFNLPEAREAVRWMTNWIARRAVHYDTTIEPRAASMLAEMVGADLFTADNEVAKLAIYLNGERAINEADVALLTTNISESKVYELSDLISRRRGREAAIMLHRLLDAREEPLALMGMITTQFRRLLQAKSFVGGGGDARELATVLNIKPFPAKLLIEQLPNFTLEQLEAIYRSLLDTDYRIKTGQIEGSLALDLLVAGLAS